MSDTDTDEPRRGPGRPSPYAALELRVAAIEAELCELVRIAELYRDPGIIGFWVKGKIDARKAAAKAARAAAKAAGL